MDPKTDPSQKTATLKQTLHKNRQLLNVFFTKIVDLKRTLHKINLKTDAKIKNYKVILHTRSGANMFTRELLKKKINKLLFFTEINPFRKIKRFFTKVKKQLFHKNEKLFNNNNNNKKYQKITSKFCKNRTLKKKNLDEPLVIFWL